MRRRASDVPGWSPCPTPRSRRGRACPGAPLRQGSFAALPSSARRPRGRRQPPRRRHRRDRGRCPWACRPSATQVVAVHAPPRVESRSSTAAARPGARRATGWRRGARPRRQLAGPRDQLVAGHACASADQRLAVLAGAARPRPGGPSRSAGRRSASPAGRRRRSTRRTPRRRRQVRGAATPRPVAGRRARPAEQPRARRAGQDRAVERRRGQLDDVAAGARTRKMLALVASRGGRRSSGTARRRRRPRASSGRRRSRPRRPS
jgi:hypothetical protein